MKFCYHNAVLDTIVVSRRDPKFVPREDQSDISKDFETTEMLRYWQEIPGFQSPDFYEV
jgi:hypothetical protein